MHNNCSLHNWFCPVVMNFFTKSRGSCTCNILFYMRPCTCYIIKCGMLPHVQDSALQAWWDQVSLSRLEPIMLKSSRIILSSNSKNNHLLFFFIPIQYLISHILVAGDLIIINHWICDIAECYQWYCNNQKASLV